MQLQLLVVGKGHHQLEDKVFLVVVMGHQEQVDMVHLQVLDLAMLEVEVVGNQ